MLSTPESNVVPKPVNQKNVVINFVDGEGVYRTRNYDLFDTSHREKILKTIEFALIHKIELRIRNK